MWCSLPPSRGGVLQLRGNLVRGSNSRRVFSYSVSSDRERERGGVLLQTEGFCGLLRVRHPQKLTAVKLDANTPPLPAGRARGLAAVGPSTQSGMRFADVNAARLHFERATPTPSRGAS